jgi:chromosome segregation ATPase
MDLNALRNEVNAERRRIDALSVEAKMVGQEGSSLRQEILELERASEELEKAAILLASISEERQKEAQVKIESLVTQGLQKIFGPEWSFHVVPSVKGKTPIVEFKVRTSLSNGSVLETSVVDSRGAGLASVVGFLLRLVLLLLSKKASVLILDETFANLSDSYIPRLIEFIREVVDKTNLQIIMVTHEQRFAEVADRCYHFSLDKNGMTKVSSF